MTTRTKTEAAMTVRRALRDGMARLAQARTPSHTLAAELLLIHALGCDREWVYAHPEEMVATDTARRFFGFVAQRVSGVPTQYLTGKQEFWGLEFEVTPAVLIPRPETEHVIEVVMERLGAQRRQENLRAADIGTGSGCIAVALATELCDAKIVATDISGEALEVARRNAKRHGVLERIQFVECDLLSAAAAGGPVFDLIVSNPPYLARNEEAQLPQDVRAHEPHQALFGGVMGTEIYARLIAEAAEHLRCDGLLAMEIGYGALEEIRLMLQTAEWRDIHVTNDLAGIPRVVSTLRASATSL
jgi:release factor glutamine methyltransferase